jgi:hypothetical protein
VISAAFAALRAAWEVIVQNTRVLSCRVRQKFGGNPMAKHRHGNIGDRRKSDFLKHDGKLVILSEKDIFKVGK